MGTTTAATLASYRKLVPAAAKVDKHRKEIVPRFDKLKARMKDAAKGGDGTMLGVYSTALTAEINHITTALHDVNEAQVLLHEVREDEEFVSERLDAVAKVAKVVADGEKALTERFKQAKALENEAEKATESAYESPDERFRELAFLDRNVEDAKKRVNDVGRKVDVLKTKADAALSDGDAKALEQAKAALKALGVAELHLGNDTFLEFSGSFIERIEASKYENSAKVELIDGARDLLKEAKTTAGRIDEIKQVAKEIEAMALDAIDAKKALKVLGLDAKHLTRLSKALAVSKAELERSLDALVRELKLADTSGKQLLGELRKAGVVPR